MKILVTGGAGYIGSHTVVALHQAGYTPVIVDDFRNSNQSAIEGIEKIIGEKVNLCIGNCVDKDFLRQVFRDQEKIDGVIHFVGDKSVAESIKQPLKYYNNNINSLLSVLEIMQEFDVTNLIFSSSATVYGNANSFPITEDFPRMESASPYGNTKQICEDIIFDTVKSKSFNLKSIALRYFNPIGAHESGLIGELPLGVPNNLLPYLTQATAKKRESLTIYGNDYETPDGFGVRDYIHVADLAEAHVASLDYLATKKESHLYDIFNVGTGNGVSVMELITRFELVNNVKVPFVIGKRREGDIATCYADVKKIKKAMNWSAKRSIDDSLRDAWRWELKCSS